MGTHGFKLWIILLSITAGSLPIVHSNAAEECCYLEAPSDLMVIENNDDGIALSWQDNSWQEEGFVIERCRYDDCRIDNHNFRILATVDENVTWYIDDEVLINTNYLYRVKAFTQDRESGYSNTVMAQSHKSGVIVYCFITAILSGRVE